MATIKNVQLSEEKINQLATDISNRLFESHYFNKGSIGGDALTDFSDHVQINRFLLFQVYQVWHLQVSRFKHPYFDFEQPEIKEKLKQLQNLLSRNISISQEDFKPMLKKAVYNNLRLLVDPQGALINFFFQTREKIDIELYARYAPFFSDFDFVVNSILRYHQKNGMKTIDKDVFALKMDRVIELFNEKSNQDADTYRSLRFLQLTNHPLDEVIADDQREIQAREAKKAEEAARLEAERKAAEAERKESEKSFFDTLEPVGNPEVFEIAEEEKQAETPTAREEKSREEIPIALEDAATPEEEVATEMVTSRSIPIETEEKEEKQAEVKTPEPEEKPQAEEPAEESQAEQTEEEPQAELKTQADRLREMAGKGTSTVLRRVSRMREEQEDQSGSVLDRFAEKEEEKPKTVMGKAKEEAKKEKTPEAKKEPEVKKEEKPAIEIPIETKQAEEPQEEKKSEKTSASVLDRFSKKEPEEQEKDETPRTRTLADRLREEGTASPAGKKIQPDDIPIHKQYQYVQKVFGGNNVRFRIIVDKVNNSQDKEELEDILQKFVFGNEDVNSDDPVVKEFAALLRTRF